MAEPVAIPGTSERISLGFAISKVDKERRVVSGIATAEVPDRQGDIVSFDGSVRAFEKWAGNVRYQHDPKRPIGKAIQWTPMPAEKAIAVDVQLSRSTDGDNALKDIEDGILRGFSIQGNITDARPIVQKATDGEMKNYRLIKDYTMDELSAVDVPACPTALITLVKSVDGGLFATEALGQGEEPATPTEPATSESAPAPQLIGGFTPEQIREATARKIAAENAKTFGIGAQLPPVEATPPAATSASAASFNPTAIPPQVLTRAMGGTLTDAINIRKAMEGQATPETVNTVSAITVPAPRVTTPLGATPTPVVSISAALAELRTSLSKRDEDPDVGGGVDRDKLDADDFAGPDRTFPIVTPKDVHDAIPNLNHTDHDKDAIKAKIIAIAYRKGKSFVDELPADWKRDDDKEEKAAGSRQPTLTKDASVPKPGEGYRSATVGYKADFVLDPATFRFLNPQDVPMAIGSVWKAKDPEAARATITEAAYKAGPLYVAQLPPDWRRATKVAKVASRAFAKCLDDYGWSGSPDVQTAANVLKGLDAVLASETREANQPGGGDDDDKAQIDALRTAITSVLSFLDAELTEYYGAVGAEPGGEMAYAAGTRPGTLRKEGRRHNAGDASQIQTMHDMAVSLGAVCQEQSAPTEGGPVTTHPSDAIKSAAGGATTEEFDDVNADQIIKAINTNTDQTIKTHLGGLATKDDLRKAVDVMGQLDARVAKLEAQPAYDPSAPATNDARPVPVEKALGSEPSGAGSDSVTLYKATGPTTFSKADVDKMEVEWRTTTDTKRRQELGMTLALIDMKVNGQA